MFHSEVGIFVKSNRILNEKTSGLLKGGGVGQGQKILVGQVVACVGGRPGTEQHAGLVYPAVVFCFFEIGQLVVLDYIRLVFDLLQKIAFLADHQKGFHKIQVLLFMPASRFAVAHIVVAI